MEAIEPPSGSTGLVGSIDLSQTSKNEPLIHEDMDATVAANSLCMMGRKRAQSVTAPSVDTVIVKAKRAASSLWMLLHSQNCAILKCPHTGCHEAKLLHLHLKTCPAGSGLDCPVHFPGCDKARKLLAHYRRCRTTRARQVGQLTGRRDFDQQQCLVCSLVARQARTMLERSSVKGPGSSGTSTNATATTRKQTVANLVLDVPTKIIGEPLTSSNASNQIMPPPPPRRVHGDSIVDSSPPQAGQWVYSPPSQDQLRHEMTTSIAALVNSSVPCLPGEELGKSFDSAEHMVQGSPRRGRDRSLSTTTSQETHYYATSNACSRITLPTGRQQRRRSASVGSSPTLVTHPDCDTILEDGEPLESREYLP